MLRFSTYEESFDELLENEGLKKKAAKSGISLGTLKKVYNRGMAAWRTGHRPGTTPQQWGMARVNSYITKGKGTYYGADSDLSGKGKKKEKKEGYVSMAQQRAVWATRKDGGKGHPDNKKKNKKENVNELSKTALSKYVKAADADKSKKHVKADVGKISRDDAFKNQVKRNRGITMAKSKMNPVKVKATEGNVQEISKTLAKNYIGKAARDMYHKGQQQGTADAISRLGGPTKSYKKSPERKAAMRVRGMDRATNRLMKKEEKRVVHSDKPDSLKSIKVITPKTKKNEAMSDAEKKAHDAAIAAFKAKGGKVKKLKPGYAQGYHGKADPAAGMKGMMDKGDTRAIGTRKKVGSMK